MKGRIHVALGAALAALAALIGVGFWLHTKAAPASDQRKAVVTELPNPTKEVVAPFDPWEKQAPNKPLDASQLDQYLEKVVARSQKYPQTADDAHELGLAVIAEVMPSDDLGAIVMKQREFTAKMRIAAQSAPAHLPTLPDDLKTILAELKRNPSASARDELIQRYMQKASALPGATQIEAVDQLKEAASE